MSSIDLLRRTATTVVAVTGALLLIAGCSSSGSSESSSSPSEAAVASSAVAPSEAASDVATNAAATDCPAAGTTIAYTPITGELDWFSAIEGELQARADACGVELLKFDPAGDAAKQADGIETFITSGAKAIGISAVDSDAIKSAVADAKAKGIYIVQHVSAVPDFDANVGVPEADFGRMIGEVGGEWIVATKPDETEYQVAILNADSLGEGLLTRKQGLIYGLESALGGKPYKIVSDVEAYAEDKALDATASILSANPEVDLILTVNDAGALGALAAIESAGLTPNVDVATVGSLTQRGLEAVIAGKMPGGITVPGPPHGDALADVMFGLLTGTLKAGADVQVPPTQVRTAEEAQAAIDAGGL